MKKQYGFTIIELIITMVVLAILLTLGVVGMRGVQVSARDAERRSDVETLARGLEQRYTRGNPVVTSAPGSEAKAGSYPGINEIVHIDGGDRSGQSYVPAQVVGGYRTTALPGTSIASFTNPAGTSAWAAVCLFACQPAGNAAQLTAAFGGQDLYVYEPADVSGNICCCGDCKRFTVYWKNEVDGTTQSIKSKHQ